MTVKELTHQRILEFYQEHGLEFAISVARNLIEKNNRKNLSKEVRTALNGELAESVLEICIDAYSKEHPAQTKDWLWGKGLILKDPFKESDFLTELDFTLFTPECIYLFECKSYAGNKRLVDKGTIIREVGNSCDVYRQSLLHTETLDKWLSPFSRTPEYQMVLFDFSRGDVIDERTPEFRNYLKYVNEKTLASVFTYKEKVWDMECMKSVLVTLNRAKCKLSKKHLEYVKTLHKEG